MIRDNSGTKLLNLRSKQTETYTEGGENRKKQNENCRTVSHF